MKDQCKFFYLIYSNFVLFYWQYDRTYNLFLGVTLTLNSMYSFNMTHLQLSELIQDVEEL